MTLQNLPFADEETNAAAYGTFGAAPATVTAADDAWGYEPQTGGASTTAHDAWASWTSTTAEQTPVAKDSDEFKYSEDSEGFWNDDKPTLAEDIVHSAAIEEGVWSAAIGEHY